MDHNHDTGHPIAAAFSLLISMISAFIAFISLHDAQTVVTFVAGCIAIISGCLAARYYYYSTKKIKAENKTSKHK